MNNPLVQPDPGLYIWTILTFLILVGCWRSSRGGRCWRHSTSASSSIRKALDDARQAKQELAADPRRVGEAAGAGAQWRRRRSSRAAAPTPTGSGKR